MRVRIDLPVGSQAKTYLLCSNARFLLVHRNPTSLPIFLGDLMVKLNPNRTERKTFKQEKKNPKHSNVWEWDETRELREFIDKQLRK